MELTGFQKNLERLGEVVVRLLQNLRGDPVCTPTVAYRINIDFGNVVFYIFISVITPYTFQNFKVEQTPIGFYAYVPYILS